MNETGNTAYISAETVPPAPDIVERVARAIRKEGFAYKAANGGDDCNWSDIPDEVFARAAIEAMREPTPAMSARACNALKRHIDSFTEEERVERWPGRKDDNGWRVPNKEKHRVRYQAMIDAALKVQT